MKYKYKIAAAIIGVAVFGLIFWGIRSSQELTGEQILTRTAITYKNCRSYRDSGTIKYSLGGLSVEGVFTTAFVRPDRFRYELKANSKAPTRSQYKPRDIHYIVGRQGTDTFQFYNLHRPKLKKSDSFPVAIAGATGISGFLATAPVDLLLPDEMKASSNITNLQDVSRLKDEKSNGRDCYRIEGIYLDKNTTLWIDKQTFLIRRIDWQGEIVNTTIWEPIVDAAIADEALELKIPPQ